MSDPTEKIDVWAVLRTLNGMAKLKEELAARAPIAQAPEPAEEKPARGYVTREFTVWCGACSEWDQQPGPMPLAKRRWERAGWRNTRAHGWRCPAHATA